jgi:hypothetical protein
VYEQIPRRIAQLIKSSAYCNFFTWSIIKKRGRGRSTYVQLKRSAIKLSHKKNSIQLLRIVDYFRQKFDIARRLHPRRLRLATLGGSSSRAHASYRHRSGARHRALAQAIGIARGLTVEHSCKLSATLGGSTSTRP